MYHVIIVLDETRNKSYYYSYVIENGNVECEELPPYQDITKARSCYWDAESTTWIYDAEKYAELEAVRIAEKEAAEKKAAEDNATPSNADLALALMEVAENVSILVDAITEIAGEVAMLKGGE